MRILLSTLGTSGDIIPFARMAHLLLSRGHLVTIHCPRQFGGWFPSAANIIFSAGYISNAKRDVIFERALRETTPNAQKVLFARWFYGLGETDERARAYYNHARQIFESHDLALINVIDHIGQIAAEHIGLPWVCYTSRPPSDPAVADPPNADIDTAVSALLSRISNKAIHIRTFRTLSPLLTLVGCSPSIAPPQPAASVKITGAWLDLPRPQSLSPELEEFLSKGPTLVTTFGTMPDVNGRTQALVHAAHMSGWRAIVQVIAATPTPRSIPEGVLVTHERLPFDALFPRVNAIVHHGGSGTTHEILRAGRPSLVVPHMADQFFWGYTVHKNGLGPSPVQYTDIDADTLVEKMTELKLNEYVHHAAALAPAIASEHGISVAADLIESLQSEVA
jgi:UDP:flavonoid glycosyltransferase YjiC (YdhE family)